MKNTKTKKLLKEVLSRIDFSNTSGKNNDKQILRAAILAEIDAINLYEQMSEVVVNKKVKKVLLDIAREEKTHIGEFNALLKQLDVEYNKELKNGEKEIKEIN
jgi:rubrerythrin